MLIQEYLRYTHLVLEVFYFLAVLLIYNKALGVECILLTLLLEICLQVYVETTSKFRFFRNMPKLLFLDLNFNFLVNVSSLGFVIYQVSQNQNKKQDFIAVIFFLFVLCTKV